LNKHRIQGTVFINVPFIICGRYYFWVIFGVIFARLSRIRSSLHHWFIAPRVSMPPCLLPRSKTYAGTKGKELWMSEGMGLMIAPRWGNLPSLSKNDEKTDKTAR